MAKNNNLTDFLTSEANKFRSVLGTQGTIDPQDFDDLIDDVYDKGYNDAPSGTDVSDTTATQPDVLETKYFYNSSGNKVQGTMVNRGSRSGTISLKNGAFTIAQGYHDGTGTVTINPDERAKIIASNIKSGISILGVEGSFSDVTQTIYGTVTQAENSKDFYFNAAEVANPIKYIIMYAGDYFSGTSGARTICYFSYLNGYKWNGYRYVGSAFFYNGASGNRGVQYYRYLGNSTWSITDEDKLSTGECYVSFLGSSENYFRSGVTYFYVIGA